MRRILLAAAAVAIAGCSGRVEYDDRPTFRIDRAKAFRLEFGRGSGWRGLETIRVSHDGSVVLHRLKHGQREPSWETATMRLSPSELAEILQAVETNGLMKLGRAYHDPGVADGTQWLLWLKQGEQEKSVYFDNEFPQSIRQFAEQLDAILSRAGLDKAIWQPVPASRSRRHELELWDSIKRKS